MKVGEIPIYFDATNRCDNDECEDHRLGRCMTNQVDCPLRRSVTKVKK